MAKEAQIPILIVDDDSNFLIPLKKILERNGYRVVCIAQDGLEATECLFCKCIDLGIELVLMDIIMPKMGGLQALDEIKAKSHSIQVVLMSAYGDSTLRKEALAKGAAAFIEKPFEKNELLDLIEEVVQRRQRD